MEVASLNETIKELREKNKKLSEKNKVQQENIRIAEAKIKSEEEKNRSNETIVQCINRAWTQLEEDIQKLYKSGNFKVNKNEDNAMDIDLKDIEKQDPFLSKLLSYYSPNVLNESNEVMRHLKELKKISSDFENNLKMRSIKTLSMFKQLLEEITIIQNKSDEHIMEITTEKISKSDINNMPSLNRVLIERVRILEDKFHQREGEVNNLNEDLLDVRSDLESSKMKVYSMKSAISELENQIKVLKRNQLTATAAAAPLPVPSVVENQENKIKEDPGIGDSNAAQEEIEKLRQELASANANLEREETALINCQKELRKKQLDMENEYWVRESVTYNSLMEEKQKLEDELNKKTIEIDRLNLKIQQKDAEQHRKNAIETNSQNLKLLQEAQKKIGKLQSDLSNSEKLKLETDQVQLEKMSQHHLKTAKELKLTIKTLEDEIERVSKRLRMNKSDEEKIKTLEKEAIESSKQKRHLHIKIGKFEEKVNKLETMLKEFKEKNLEHHLTIGDLKAFVEVLLVSSQEGSNGNNEGQQQQQGGGGGGGVVAEVSAREKAHTEEISLLRHKLERLKIKMMNSDSENTKVKMVELTEQVEKLKIQLTESIKKYTILVEHYEKQKEIQKGFEIEIEETGKAYENVQSQNMQLIQELSERDELIDELRTEFKKMEMRLSDLEAEKKKIECDNETIKINNAGLNEMIGVHEKKSAEFDIEIKNRELEIKKYQKQLEILKLEKLEFENKINNIETQVDESKQINEDMRDQIDKEVEKSLREANRRQRAENELNRLRGCKLAKSGLDGSGDDLMDYSELNEEIEMLRSMLRCSVCSTNQKSVILSKCNHVFCNECIISRIAIRNRKCPACGASFSQAEVKKFYLT